jgi:hypothetical protein
MISTRDKPLANRAHRPRKHHRRPRRMPSYFCPHTILIRRRCISTTRRALSSWRVLLRRQRVLKPRGGRFRFSPPLARCAHVSLPFLSILPSRYPSRIVHLIYAPTLPAHILRARTQYVLLRPNIFLPFSCGLYLTAIFQPSFCILLKYLARSHASIYGILFCNQAQLYLTLRNELSATPYHFFQRRSREARFLRAARRTYIYTLAV